MPPRKEIVLLAQSPNIRQWGDRSQDEVVQLDDVFSQQVALGKVDEDDCERFAEFMLLNWGSSDRIDQACAWADMWKTLDRIERQRGVTPTTGPRAVPPDETLGDPPASMDDEAKRLYREVQAHGSTKQLPFLLALADKTGQPPPSGADVPAVTPMFDADDPRGETDRRARALMRSHDIGYADAAQLADLDDRLQEAHADTGFSETPWVDTSRPLQPRPWVDDDFERDKRRAAAAGLPEATHPDRFRLDWEQAANEGRDLVHELATASRVDAVASADVRRKEHLDRAHQTERAQRIKAVNHELYRRASSRMPPRG